ncbi:C-terminal binding protein [Pseudooceanicola onchidii]|uniref:C-terminal binding protein n=1 Tax=Pseudooceanicola onchidii TaxID=2562279 RepID=UPI0010AA2815|nr:C-terminal binding protein [Pseudooceanicola onchidii]
MTTPTIAVLEPGYATYDTETSVLGAAGARIVAVGEGVDAVPALRDLNPQGILVRERTIGQAELAACPDLRVVVRYGVGTDNIDLDAARDRGVYVANVPDYGAEHEVSDHALALYLSVQRRVVTRDAEVRAGHWGIGQAAPIPDRDGAVLGLIGCGRIGLVTLAKFRAFGFARVLVHDPFMSEDAACAAGVKLTDMDTLCATADVISLHAPLTPDTRHILNADRLARVKPTTIVINVSRGGLVDEAALAAALTEGRLFGAGIDVFEVEPIRPGNPLMAAPNTLLSDHNAWYSERSVALLQRKAAEEIARVLSGQPPVNWVNRWSPEP